MDGDLKYLRLGYNATKGFGAHGEGLGNVLLY